MSDFALVDRSILADIEAGAVEMAVVLGSARKRRVETSTTSSADGEMPTVPEADVIALAEAVAAGTMTHAEAHRRLHVLAGVDPDDQVPDELAAAEAEADATLAGEWTL